MPHERELGRRRAEVRAAAPGAADVDRAGDAARARQRLGLDMPGRPAPASAARAPAELGLDLLAHLGADAHQVAPRRLGVAAAERELRAGLGDVADRDAAPARVECRSGGARACRRRTCRARPRGWRPRRPSRSSLASGDRSARPASGAAAAAPRAARGRRAQVAQQAIERRLAVELDHDVALGRRHLARTGPTGWQPCVTRDTSATSRSNATPDRPPLSTPSAMWRQRRARRREAAEQVAAGGAPAHLADQLGEVGAWPGRHAPARCAAAKPRERPRRPRRRGSCAAAIAASISASAARRSTRHRWPRCRRRWRRPTPRPASAGAARRAAVGCARRSGR